jgi:hypothetical protein
MLSLHVIDSKRIVKLSAKRYDVGEPAREGPTRAAGLAERRL